MSVHVEKIYMAKENRDYPRNYMVIIRENSRHNKWIKSNINNDHFLCRENRASATKIEKNRQRRKRERGNLSQCHHRPVEDDLDLIRII